MLYRTSRVVLSPNLAERIPLLTRAPEDGDTVLLTPSEWSPRLAFASIVFAPKTELDEKLEKRAVVCYNEEWLRDWLAAPSSRGTYVIDGFKGLRKFYFHLQLKGWKLDYRSSFIDYHKIDLRGEDTSNYGKLKSKVKSCLDPKGSREYLAKNTLANLPNAEFFVPSYRHLTRDFQPEEGNVYIIKPIGVASSGEGVTAFSTKEEYKKALAKIRGRWKEAVVCRYIDNPLLLDGRKFHLRCYLFVSTSGVWSLYPDAKILTAGAPYKKSDYTNAMIHDTHARTTDSNYFFREEFTEEDQARIWPGVELIAQSVASSPFVGYPGAVTSYDILGLDVLIDDNWHCWLLEANFAPSMDPIAYAGYERFERSYFEWEVALASTL